MRLEVQITGGRYCVELVEVRASSVWAQWLSWWEVDDIMCN